jgi:phosphatidylethanolamine-binding protein (PEBP) family uncharacterized protein
MRRTQRKRYRNRKTRKAKRVQKGGQQSLSVAFPSFQASEELPTKLLPETQAAPTISWPSSSSLKTILCWDPDAPAKSWVHLLSINCSGTDPSSGTEVFSWDPPSPPAGTGRHRYLFTLYEQKGPIELTLSERGNVAVEEIVQQKGLKKIAEVGFKTAA